MKVEFSSKAEIVKTLVDEWGEKETSFYNTSTNKSVEKFWTFNRTLQHLFKLRREYVKTEYGVMLKSFYENVYSK
jgi:hypothetical protein